MQDAGESDGGAEKAAARPFQDTSVELRKSCDYCVRLKRACDGKNPCSLCARRNKPCTRSARKKSGPAKGTKYAPRRKRSVIAEWADRTSGARQPHLPEEFLGAGAGSGVGEGGGGARSSSLGGGGGRPFPIAPAEAAGAPRAPGMSYYGGGLSSHAAAAPGGRFGAEASWEEESTARPLSGHHRGRRQMEFGGPSSMSTSMALSLPMGWYASAEHERAETEARGGGDRGGSRQMSPRLHAPPMGYAPTTAEEFSRRQQHYASSYHHGSWSMSSLEAEGLRERPGAAREPYRRRTLEPSSRSWASQPDPFPGSPPEGVGLTHGTRVRMGLPSFVDRPLMRPTAEFYPSPAPSAREREMAGRPPERTRELEPASLPFLPPPREPPDPTAGFAFHPGANLPSWRRGSHASNWDPESPGGGGGTPIDRDPGAHHQYAQQPTYFDSSERLSSSWDSAGGGGGRVRGGNMGDPRYRDFEGQGRQGEWHLPHGAGGGADAYHERLELPPPPHAFDRHLPIERPLVGRGGQRQDGEEMLFNAPLPPQGEQGYGHGARSADSTYEDPSGRLRWPSGGIDQMEIYGRGSRDPRDHLDDQQQQRFQPRQQEWEGPFQWESERSGDPRRPTGQGRSGAALPPSSASSALQTGRSSQQQRADVRASSPALGFSAREQIDDEGEEEERKPSGRRKQADEGGPSGSPRTPPDQP